MSYRRAICEREFDEIIHLGGKMRMWKSDFFFTCNDEFNMVEQNQVFFQDSLEFNGLLWQFSW